MKTPLKMAIKATANNPYIELIAQELETFGSSGLYEASFSKENNPDWDWDDDRLMSAFYYYEAQGFEFTRNPLYYSSDFRSARLRIPVDYIKGL